MSSVSAENSSKPEINPILKLVLELGPLMVFFFGNSRGKQLQNQFPALESLGDPIFVATALFMVALGISLIVSWILTRTWPIMPVVTFVFVAVMGGLTIWLQNDTFIKMKPTLVNALFGTILLAGLAMGRNFLKLVLDAAFQLDEDGWNKLAMRWGLFFFILAIVNELVWRNFSTDFWVGFKVWGTIPLTILFTATQIPLIQRHSLETPENEEADGKST